MELVTVAGADAIAWIREHGRFKRTLDVITLRRALNRQSKQCGWCGRQCEGRRYHWCSPGCSAEFFCRTAGNAQRGFVEERDGGVCSSCGVNTNRLRAAIGNLRTMAANLRHGYKIAENRERAARIMKFCDRWSRSEGFGGYYVSWWQADHIVPVCEGGGLCGLEGLRTLCTRCHKRETKALAARRALARRKWAHHEQHGNAI